MDPGYEPDDHQLIEALRRPAPIPLGLTARLEVAVRRRAREEIVFTAEEKLCLGPIAVLPLLGGGAGGVLVLALAALGVLGYLQWTLLLDERA